MSDIGRKKSTLLKDCSDEGKIVTKWGENGDEANLLQQTKNCIFCCRLLSGDLNKEDAFQSIDNFLNKNYFCSMADAKSKNAQQFWMFHRADKKEIYVVFVSQESSAHILVDADVWNTPKYKDSGRADIIPTSLFKALILEGYNVVFTGHSLGGAVAILAACKLVNRDLEDEEIKRIRCITFGAPQVPYYVPEYIPQLKHIIYRYELPADPVPQLLTAFQNQNNYAQEFLVNLMNLIGVKHSLRNTADVQLGLKDYIQVDQSVIQDIKKYSKFGTPLVPKQTKQGWFLKKSKFYMDDLNDWIFVTDTNQQQGKIKLSSLLQQFRQQHTFERYKEEIYDRRIALFVLPKVSDEYKQADMVTCRIPGRQFWRQGPANIQLVPNQIQALFNDRFTKVIITSTLPHIFGIRYAQVSNFVNWGIESAKVVQDRGEFKVMIVFYSARDYKTLQTNQNVMLSLTLHGCFESVEDIKVQAIESNTNDTEEMINLAYKDINIQHLYTSAFQTCLFAGEGHNPMLHGPTLSQDRREALLKQDHSSLVEMLGSIIVNQQINKIISQQTWRQFQQLLLNNTKLQHCNSQYNENLLTVEKNKLVCYIKNEAQENIGELYHKFQFKPTNQVQAGQMSAKDCISQSITTLFCLSSLLVWQLKSNFKSGILLGIKSEVFVLSLLAGGFAGGLGACAVGMVIFVRNVFINFMQNYETMQMQYKQQLVSLVLNLGLQPKESHSIADLEKKVSETCQWLLQQEEIGYDYKNSEHLLNSRLLQCLTRKQKATSSTQDEATEEGDQEDDQNINEILKDLIERKIEYLSHADIFKYCDKDIKLKPSRTLAALLIFVWNNYRIRICLSKTLRIGIMGAKNAGKSTLSKFLGCAIPRTGQNHSTTVATLYQNVPVRNFCVIDFPHLDFVNEKDCMRMVYPLVDVAIIVLKSQDGASEQGKNDEIGQIIKAMKLKYGNLGYSNRKLPILLLLNQVDQMVFDRPEDENEEEEGSSDETLKQKFEHDKLDIFKNLEAAYVGFDKEKIQYLFTSFRPSFPQPPPEKAEQWLKELCNNNITAYEYNKRMRCGGKKRLQQITGCSFFKFEAEAEQNDESIVNVLAKIVENLGDKDEANAMRAMFDDRDDVVVVNNPEHKNPSAEDIPTISHNMA